MFFRKKKKNRLLDKIIMGAIVGGAIGSVLGASIAPKKGKETREELKGIARNAGTATKNIFYKIRHLIKREKEKKIPTEE